MIANQVIKMIIFDVSFSPYRLSALMVDGWLPWQWIALFAHGISPPGGKTEARQRLFYGKQLDFCSDPVVILFLAVLSTVSSLLWHQ